MPRWLKWALPALVFLLLAALPLARQYQSGTIEGMVTDSHGPVADASVQARSLLSGAVFSIQSDAGGQFVIEHLRAGPYSLWVEARGHSSLWIPRVVVEAGQVTHQDVFLERSPFGPWGG